MYYIYLLAGLVVVLEIFIFLQKKKIKKNLIYRNKLKNFLDILRAFSFLHSSKHQLLKEDLDDLAATFLKQGYFTSITIKLKGESFTYPQDETIAKTSAVLGENLIAQSVNKINFFQNLPENTQDFQSGVVSKLIYQESELGHIIMLGNQKIEFDQNLQHLLGSINGMVALLVKKHQFIKTLSSPQQYQAVHVQW